MRLLPGWSMGNPGVSKFWCRETMGEGSLWYWHVGPGERDSIRRLVIESGREGWGWSFRASVEGDVRGEVCPFVDWVVPSF